MQKEGHLCDGLRQAKGTACVRNSITVQITSIRAQASFALQMLVAQLGSILTAPDNEAEDGC